MKSRVTLALRGACRLLSGLVTMGLLLFLPAGTTDYPGAWRMLAILFLPMLILGSVLLLRSPALLEKRLGMKESEPAQKKVILFSVLMFTVCFLLCALDFRFGWTRVPGWLCVAGCVVFLLSYLGFGELLRENAYLSRTVEVQQDQQVVSAGLYGIVRHPMYFIILFMFLSMPLIIGSFIGLIPLIGLPVILAERIRSEEEVLSKGLPGYDAYRGKVRYRLIPFIW